MNVILFATGDTKLNAAAILDGQNRRWLKVFQYHTFMFLNDADWAKQDLTFSIKAIFDISLVVKHDGYSLQLNTSYAG